MIFEMSMKTCTPISETFRAVKAGSIKPEFVRYLRSSGNLLVSIDISDAFLALGERPSLGSICARFEGDKPSDFGYRNGLEIGRSLFRILTSDFGGEGEVGGDPASPTPGLGRPMMSAMSVLRSGDRLRDSSSSPDSASVPVSETSWSGPAS